MISLLRTTLDKRGKDWINECVSKGSQTRHTHNTWKHKYLYILPPPPIVKLSIQILRQLAHFCTDMHIHTLNINLQLELEKVGEGIITLKWMLNGLVIHLHSTRTLFLVTHSLNHSHTFPHFLEMQLSPRENTGWIR